MKYDTVFLMETPWFYVSSVIYKHVKGIVYYHGSVLLGNERKYCNGCYEKNIPLIKAFECSPMILA